MSVIVICNSLFAGLSGLPVGQMDVSATVLLLHDLSLASVSSYARYCALADLSTPSHPQVAFADMALCYLLRV